MRTRIEFVRDNFHTLCRFCCAETINLSPVLQDCDNPAECANETNRRYNRERNIGILLEQKYLKYNPAEEVGMPNFICEKCVDSLVRWHRFQECFTNATALLLEVRGQLNGPSDVDQPNEVVSSSKTDCVESSVIPSENEAYEIKYVQTLPENALLDNVTIVETIEEECGHETEEILIESREDSDCSEFNGFDESKEEIFLEDEEAGSGQISETSADIDETVKKKTNTQHIPQQCPVCGVIVRTKMRHHLMRHEDPAGRPFKCPECAKSYSFKRTLDDHIRQVHHNIRYECDLCRKQFVSRDVLRVHRKLHANEEYRCQICGQSFPVRIYLKKHMVMHEQKRFSCDGCDKTFRFKEQLKQHVRIHTGEKPFVCGACPKAFRTSAHLKQHQRTHTQAKVFGCKLCPVAYANKRSLERHVRQHQQP